MSNDQIDSSPEAPQRPDATRDAGNSKRPECPEEVKSGVATDLWLSLLPYPPDKKKCLCLRVDEEWRHLDPCDPFIWQSVQSAFCDCPCLEVFVWYRDSVIVGLVVRSKYSLEECDRRA
jgi:hypothetical protein